MKSEPRVSARELYIMWHSNSRFAKVPKHWCKSDSTSDVSSGAWWVKASDSSSEVIVV